MEFTFQTPDGKVHTLTLTQSAYGSYITQINEREYTVMVQHDQNGVMRLNLNGRNVLLHAAKDRNRHFVALNGKSTLLEKTTKSTTKRSSQAHAGDLTASMPGQVIEVLVAEGDPVEKGQTLILLEAMKMEMRMKAPYDGTVRRVLCKIGDAVERGQLLVEVEEDS